MCWQLSYASAADAAAARLLSSRPVTNLSVPRSLSLAITPYEFRF